MVTFSSFYKVIVWAGNFPQGKKIYNTQKPFYVINHTRVAESIKYLKNHLWRAYPYHYCVQIKVVNINVFTEKIRRSMEMNLSVLICFRTLDLYAVKFLGVFFHRPLFSACPPSLSDTALFTMVAGRDSNRDVGNNHYSKVIGLCMRCLVYLKNNQVSSMQI